MTRSTIGAERVQAHWIRHADLGTSALFPASSPVDERAIDNIWGHSHPMDMSRLFQFLVVFLAASACLFGHLSHQLHAHHMSASHAESHDSAHAEHSAGHHDHDGANQDPLDHSHELVPAQNAVLAPAVSAPPLLLLSNCVFDSMELSRAAISLRPPEEHSRAGPPHLLRSHLNL